MVKLIAELCQNHQGNRQLLSEMIAAAAESGADYVKIQSIFSADLTHRERFDEGKTDPDGTVRIMKRPYEAEQRRLSTLDLTDDDHVFFIEECQKHRVTPITTIFSRVRIPFVARFPWPERIVKVASYDCASYPFLRELCENFDHLIISTGATYDEEIEAAAALVRNARKKLTFLHCVTRYPNTLETCNLARMEWLKQFADSVGWSDHTLVARDGVTAAKAAIALGAEWIERHFTILRENETKDGPVSIRPEHLRELREFASLPANERMHIAKESIPEWNAIIGVPTRKMSPQELLNRDYYRGRFASRVGNRWIYNWEEEELPTTNPRLIHCQT